MIDLRQYEQLKARAEAEQSRADRAAGALEQTLRQIQKEFGCDSLKAAEKELKRLEREEASAAACYEDELERVRKEYPQLFEDE